MKEINPNVQHAVPLGNLTKEVPVQVQHNVMPVTPSKPLTPLNKQNLEHENEVANDDELEVLSDELKPLTQKVEHMQRAPEKITGSNLVPLDRKTHYKDPVRFTSIEHLRGLFAEIANHQGISDIIILPDEPVAVKIKRKGLRAITYRILNLSECERIIALLTGDDSASIKIKAGETLSGLAKVLEQDNNEIYLAHKLSTTERTKQLAERDVQLNKFRYRYEITGCSTASNEHAFSCIMRPLPSEPYKYDELGLSLDFVHNCIVKDGIVIIAGATGEGKSTTLAAIIRYILENDTQIKGIIITHEDPIEVSYEKVYSSHSVVIQSAIGQGQNVKTFDAANRTAMRRSPDLALIGELRDAPTVEAAVELSLTGHPVFATTHANSVSAIFPRLISRFPEEAQQQKTYDIISTTRMLISQKLIRDVNGNMFAVREVLKFTPFIRNYLLERSTRPDIVIQKINGMMEKGLFGAKSYAIQGREMLEEGRIDEQNYFYLVEKGDEANDDDLASLDSI